MVCICIENMFKYIYFLVCVFDNKIMYECLYILEVINWKVRRCENEFEDVKNNLFNVIIIIVMSL